MKTIGLIGGTTWHSTLKYYKLLNEGANERLGGTHAARIVLYSVDFAELRALQDEVSPKQFAEFLAEKGSALIHAGADCILLCANTLHKYYEIVQDQLDVPVLHIADALGDELSRFHVKHPGLLGTAITMYEPFYHDRLSRGYGMTTVTPDRKYGDKLSRAIYLELSRGEVTEEARTIFAHCVNDLLSKGADAVVLGCTELYMLQDVMPDGVKVFDTLDLHVLAALNWAIENEE